MQSYAGKYIPAIAHMIHEEPFPKKIYLRGIAIGDGYSDPETVSTKQVSLAYFKVATKLVIEVV